MAMGLFSRKKKSDTVSAQILELLMTSKVEQMISTDAAISLLIQKGVFTKEEFYEMKQTINNTTQYQKIRQMSDELIEALNPESLTESLTDDELNEILNCVRKDGK